MSWDIVLTFIILFKVGVVEIQVIAFLKETVVVTHHQLMKHIGLVVQQQTIVLRFLQMIIINLTL